MNTETQNHTPEFTVEAGRQILRNGKPCIGITRNMGCEPVYADDITHRIAALLNAAPALLAENARLTDAVNAAQAVAAKHRAENARLRQALLDIEANLQGEDCLRERRLDSLRRVRAALAGERSEKV